jgi:hypothetical protein
MTRKIRQPRCDWRKHNDNVLKTLVLNEDHLPVDVIRWDEAMSNIFLNKMRVVESYNKDVRTVSGLTYKCPAVVIKTTYSKSKLKLLKLEYKKLVKNA